MPSPSTNTFPSVEPCDCFILHLCCAAVIIWVSAAAAAAAAAAKSLQCDSIDRSPPGSSVPGILQARTLEWVAISFSNVGKWKWSRSVVPSLLKYVILGKHINPLNQLSKYVHKVISHDVLWSRVTIYSLDLLLSQFWTSLLFLVWFKLLLLDLHTDFAGGR